MTHVTDVELRDEYARSDLAERGIDFETAMKTDPLRRSLIGAIRARRKTAARQAKASPLNYQLHDEVA